MSGRLIGGPHEQIKKVEWIERLTIKPSEEIREVKGKSPFSP
jgi:hypothetical protein